MNAYAEFLASKRQLGGGHGFSATFLPDELYDFQRSLVSWALEAGRAAIFADCGLGKTLMQLVWSRNVAIHTGRPVLILTPLAVGAQTVQEGAKFGIPCARSGRSEITVSNYQRLHHFKADDFAGIVCDESSILKNFDGATRRALTEFMRQVPYRLLCTATAAPNDYIELGTSSEALGNLGYMDMLSRFFKNDQGSNHPNRNYSLSGKWRFRGHAEREFWRWVCSWARACRRPSDLGFSDDGFDLPPLETRLHTVQNAHPLPGRLFATVAVSLKEQRQERRATLEERCERAAELVSDTGQPAVCWCHLNDEGDLLEKLIPDAVQVAGSDSDDEKEEKLSAFSSGSARVLVTKPRIAGHGLNWQHCAHEVVFPSHSFEQWYQALRRCWRFGQTRSVVVDVVASEGEVAVLDNMARKESAADAMFSRLVSCMRDELRLNRPNPYPLSQEMPAWL